MDTSLAATTAEEAAVTGPPAQPRETAQEPERGTASSPARRGMGLRGKFVLLTITMLLLFALTSTAFTALRLRTTMIQQFQATGLAIAQGLATSAVDLLLSRDASTIQSRVDEFSRSSGVAYIMLYDPDKEVVAHTFAPFIPDGLIDANEIVAMQGSKIASGIGYIDPETAAQRNIIDIAVPILAGQLGTVRVGMDQDVVDRAALQAAQNLGLIFLVAALIASVIGFIVADRTTRPIGQLVQVAERVGRGDLSQLTSVKSRDEIGLLAGTFNDTIRKLRGLLQTEEERDRERQQREELQRNIGTFLEVTTEIADGDLTRRGKVTADILGAVVDAINVTLEEIGETLVGVQRAAKTVNSGAQEMISSTEEMVQGAQRQTRDADRVSAQVAEMSQSMSQVSEIASASAAAARDTLQAAERGQASVGNTLNGMQSIRREVQGIAKRIKSLGDRSLEVSEIVETISGIASQTNLLALNAAIEASGAGEAGARFAVVADEVRKLAEDSAKATKNIAALIKNVQSEIQEAVIAMEEGTKEVENGFKVAGEAGERLQEIAQISDRSTRLADQISRSAVEQAGGVGQVAQSVQSIAQISASTETAVVDSRRAAEQLQQLAQELNAALSRFKLPA